MGKDKKKSNKQSQQSKPSSVAPEVSKEVKEVETTAKLEDDNKKPNPVAEKQQQPKTNQSTSKVSSKQQNKDEGKYFELDGAQDGQVVVRFPPEASGYLHIGHAKAALLNAHYQQLYHGKLVFRFDDTNPEKEKESFEKIIEGDIELLGIKPDKRSYTSDYFDSMLQMAETMIKSGMAYVDDTDPEQMKIEREQRIESANRQNSVEKNLQMWHQMVDGSSAGQTYCLRAKIDMKSDNGAMRDPTIYRCKPQEHPRTGNKYKVYPTYDFACPIVDSVEGITHALRTSEYMDRDAQYYWFCDALKIRKPLIAAYSRLNLMNTVLSKRKLTYFVEQGLVDGWDDPRMPTVRGILRRGLTVEGLKNFIASQGSSKAVVVMDWDKIWSFNRKVIDPDAPRYSAVEKENMVPVLIEDENLKPGQTITVALHPKNPSLGQREVPVGKKLLIDQTDAQLIQPNTTVTFISWGNLHIESVEKNSQGLVTMIKAKLDLNNKDFKKTLKVTWIEDSSKIPALLVYYDNIIKKPVLSKDDDFKEFLNLDSKMTLQAFVDGEIEKLPKNRIIQIQRKGFFICDSPYDSSTIDFTGKPAPVHLISIPDGTTDLNIFPKIVQEWKKKNVWNEPVVAATTTNSKNNEKSVAVNIDQLDSSLRSKADLMKKLEKELSTLKAQFKQQTGKDWTDDFKTSTEKQSSTGSGGDVAELDKKIRDQGDLVRKMKAEKASKDEIKAQVDELLALKSQFKQQTGTDWTPDFKPPQPSNTSVASADNVGELDKKIRDQGDLVRKMKAEKASKDQIKAQVDELLALKSQFKQQTGTDWTPDFKPQQSSSSVGGKADIGSELDQKIRDQGDFIRKLKAEKADKQQLESEVQKLLKLKSEFKEATGIDWKPPPPPSTNVGKGGDDNNKTVKPKAEQQTSNESKKKSSGNKENKNPQQKQNQSKSDPGKGGNSKVIKKQTRLGIETKKSENYSEWYTEVITKAEMIEYYDVSGCYILRPWAYSIWECIQKFFDERIKSLEVENCYFPMFISKAALETEKTHIADFAPEVAWVTKSGSSDMSEPIAIRPTSETVMYPSYAKWVQSHRDLPIRLNQWCNVVRWEFKQPTPFLRTREFLWQEGHSAFATESEALEEVYTILGFYADIYEKLLAIPVVRGKKTEKEKFAGGQMTTTCEAYVHCNGRGIQGATSHFLGQNFSKMFDIQFEDPDHPGQKCFAYQNSWGISTRTIGALVMIHGDDKGLVLPPNVASKQVVIVPCGITASTTEQEKAQLIETCKQFKQRLSDHPQKIRVKLDDSEHHSPGWKFNHWELKGVPIRVEFGPKDMAEGKFVAVRRDTGTKESYDLSQAPELLCKLLEQIQKDMFDRAKKLLNDNMTVTESWQTLLERLDRKSIIMAPFCGRPECEDKIKKDSTKEESSDESGSGPLMGAKSLCIPFDQPKSLPTGSKCVHPDCGQLAQYYTLFGRSY